MGSGLALLAAIALAGAPHPAHRPHIALRLPVDDDATVVGAPSPAPAPPAAPAPVAKGGPRDLIVPVAGVPRSRLRSSWGDARGGGTRTHHGIDIMAPSGTAVLAAADGRVEKLFHSRLGGTTLYQRSADGGWVYYYAHLAGYAPGMAAGRMLRAGDTIGYVGDTGDAGPGNYHLHFAITRMRAGEGWWQGNDVDPYPILARARPSR